MSGDRCNAHHEAGAALAETGVTPIMKRDPHLRGFHGDVSDFKGVNNTVYALHSARHLQALSAHSAHRALSHAFGN